MTLREYVSAANPRYEWFRHCQVIADVAERVASGELKRVMLFVPPRHSKSETISRLFTGYFLLKHPEKWIGLTSYSSELAYVLSRASQENYVKAGGTLSDKAGAVKHWETGKGGGLWAAGVGGPITGKGFHCFPAGTMVETEQGAIAIDTLLHLQDRPKVLSFNHEKQTVEWRPIIAAAAQRGKPLVEIILHSGRRIRCTSDHPIYCLERKYRQAGDLVPGETVIQIPAVSSLSDVLYGDGTKRTLPELLSAGTADSIPTQMRFLFDRVFQNARRVGESVCIELRRVLLRQRLQPQASQHQEPAIVQDMSTTGSKVYAALLRRLSSISFRDLEAIAGYFVRLLRGSIFSAQSSYRILWEELPEFCALSADARQGQQSLQDRDKLRRLVSEDAPRDSGKGWSLLRSLWRAKRTTGNAAQAEEWELSGSLPADDSPHRPQSTKQSGREFSNALLCLSQTAPPENRCWQTDTISSVIRLREVPELVYDVQVEGNRNFFADGVLVHNCGIIDDPLKNAEEASSAVIREKQKEWYRSTFYTRAEPGAAIVIIQTRWHEDDLSGWLLSEESGETPERWHIVNLPAIAIGSQPFPASCTVEPDWRKAGEALCPERYDLERLRTIKSRISGYYFEALYQQRPTPREGAFFKVAQIQIEDAAPVGLRTVRAWDLAASTKGDFTVGVKLGRDPATGLFWILDVQRGQWTPDDRNAVMLQAAALDGGQTRIRLAQDPGQAGVDQVQHLTRMLAGYTVSAERVSGSKEARADAIASQVNAGNVRMLRAPWNQALLEELRIFPMGRNDDQVDALADAFQQLSVQPPQYRAREFRI